MSHLKQAFHALVEETQQERRASDERALIDLSSTPLNGDR